MEEHWKSYPHSPFAASIGVQNGVSLRVPSTYCAIVPIGVRLYSLARWVYLKAGNQRSAIQEWRGNMHITCTPELAYAPLAPPDDFIRLNKALDCELLCL